MHLLVGLGNPGDEYARHRHNIGFMAVEEAARRFGFSAWRQRFHGRAAEGMAEGARVLALQPLTYMNLSGQAVAAALAFYKLTPEDVVVFHDDLDLAPGKVRVKKGGGAGGHNGLRSLDSHIGPAYWRVRLGIGHPGDKTQVHGYVLHDFAKADSTWLEPVLDACAQALPLLLAGQPDKFMNRVTMLTAPPPAAPATGASVPPAALVQGRRAEPA